MDITILEALMAEIEPYTAAQVVCKKALMDAGCESIDTTYSTDCKKDRGESRYQHSQKDVGVE